jgi:hypothetical protein
MIDRSERDCTNLATGCPETVASVNESECLVAKATQVNTLAA